MTDGAMRDVLLHGGSGEAFDRSVMSARRMAESSRARLHILHAVENPLLLEARCAVLVLS